MLDVTRVFLIFAAPLWHLHLMPPYWRLATPRSIASRIVTRAAATAQSPVPAVNFLPMSRAEQLSGRTPRQYRRCINAKLSLKSTHHFCHNFAEDRHYFYQSPPPAPPLLMHEFIHSLYLSPQMHKFI
jgi:hypothetical protein